VLFCRTWSGICYFGSTDDSTFHKQAKETATITTAKTTLGHLKTIEARDAMHEVNLFQISLNMSDRAWKYWKYENCALFVDQHWTV